MTTTTPSPSVAAKVATKENQNKLIDSLLNRFNSDQSNDLDVSPLVVHSEPMFQMTARELEALINKRPDHPVAEVFKNALKQHLHVTSAGKQELNGDAIVTVERVSVEALIDDKDMETEVTTEDMPDGRFRVRRKVLVPRKPALASGPTPLGGSVISPKEKIPTTGEEFDVPGTKRPV